MSGFLFAMAFDPYPLVGFRMRIIPRNPAGLDFLQPVQRADADDLAVAASSFSGLDDRTGTSISFCGPYCWAQFELSEMLWGAVR